MGKAKKIGALMTARRHEFDFTHGYRVRFETRRIEPTKGRPYGVKYSLTLKDPAGCRIYGIDNTHTTRRQAPIRSSPRAWRPPAGVLRLSCADRAGR
jgi:hypothetical protein